LAFPSSERRAPASIAAVEALLGRDLSQGNTTRNISPELLSALTSAYREAADENPHNA
jgi:hypothetical protein